MEKTLLKNAECTELMLDLFLSEAELTTRELYKRALDIVVKISDSKLGFFHQVSDNQREIIFTTWNEEALRNFHPMKDDHYPVNSAMASATASFNAISAFTFKGRSRTSFLLLRVCFFITWNSFQSLKTVYHQ